MTRGKDVSMLFMDIIKNMETQDMELKKLIYLYIINYAKSHPDLAILAINSFRKDAMDKQNPFLRAMAVRTMGCIRVKQITEYLMDTLRKALKDEDSYVRKTAVLTVAKLYDVSPEIIEDQGLIQMLLEMLSDGNAMVVSNTIASLQAIGEAKGIKVFSVDKDLVRKLLTALNECTEWG
jgi:vesicle coat complex subunit